MNRTPLLLTAWLASTAGAFGLGWIIHSKNTESARGDLLTADEWAERNQPTFALSRPASAGDEAEDKRAAVDEQIHGAEPLSPEDMKLAMKRVLDENDPLKRAAFFSALLNQLSPENAKEAFLALKESNGGRRRFGNNYGDEMRMLLNAWGRVDGEGVMNELMALRESRSGEEGEGGRGRGGRGTGGRGGRGGPGGGFEATGEGSGMDMMSAISGWATADADAAAKYVNGLEDKRQNRMLTAGVLSGVMVNGVDKAMDFISGISEDNEMRGRYTAMVAGEMLEQGVSEARVWADGIDDPTLKSGAMSAIAGQYAREDLDSAIDWVTEYAGEEYASRALTQVASRWANEDPQAVLDWAGSLPEETQAGVFAEALDEWTESDPLAASEYLAQMQESPAKDNAVEGFATELAREDPVSAIAWAETIGDQQLRDQTLTRVAQSWYRSDQTAAATWLESSGLSQEAQQAVQNPSRGDFGGRGRGGGRRGR